REHGGVLGPTIRLDPREQGEEALDGAEVTAATWIPEDAALLRGETLHAGHTGGIVADVHADILEAMSEGVDQPLQLREIGMAGDRESRSHRRPHHTVMERVRHWTAHLSSRRRARRFR